MDALPPVNFDSHDLRLSCTITMVATMIMSHGHLIMREIMLHWPTETSWEGRLENALYTQGGLVFIASFVVAGAMLLRGYFAKVKDEYDAGTVVVEEDWGFTAEWEITGWWDDDVWCRMKLDNFRQTAVRNV